MPRLQQKIVRTRKTHWCELCEGQLIKGRFCVYLVAIFDGVFQHGWYHVKCFDEITED